jgi:hypothetical protein
MMGSLMISLILFMIPASAASELQFSCAKRILIQKGKVALVPHGICQTTTGSCESNGVCFLHLVPSILMKSIVFHL